MNKKSSQYTDEELVVVSRKNIDFFEELMTRYEKKLMVYIMRISSFGKEDAEEILQEVFIKAWRSINGFNDRLSFSSWIYRIARNETISAFRKNRSRGLDKQDALDDHIFHLKDDKEGAHEFIEKAEDATVLRKALKGLPQKYRDVLVLYYMEDLSYKEIADVMKRSEGSVTSLLHRAKKKLQRLL
jgi:RNA polymerase sigma-70 factor (ECF subfamily)